jgi:hypothetical protein
MTGASRGLSWRVTEHELVWRIARRLIEKGNAKRLSVKEEMS